VFCGTNKYFDKLKVVFAKSSNINIKQKINTGMNVVWAIKKYESKMYLLFSETLFPIST